MPSHHDFDNNHNLITTSIPFNLQEITIQFIENNRSHHQIPQPCYSNTPSSKTLSPTQPKSLYVVLKHSTGKDKNPPLRMIMQCIAGTRTSYLIRCIKEIPFSATRLLQNPLLLLALTSVAAFNIQASTIHSTIHIPIKHLFLLEGK
jgi:hypothetical protein